MSKQNINVSVKQLRASQGIQVKTNDVTNTLKRYNDWQVVRLANDPAGDLNLLDGTQVLFKREGQTGRIVVNINYNILNANTLGYFLVNSTLPGLPVSTMTFNSPTRVRAPGVDAIGKLILNTQGSTVRIGIEYPTGYVNLGDTHTVSGEFTYKVNSPN